MNRVYIFIDWWNFTLDWEKLVGRTKNNDRIRIDWNALPKHVVEGISRISGSDAEYSGTNVYASVASQRTDVSLRQFFQTMRGWPGYSVQIFDRKSRTRPIHCSSCGHEVADCPSCSKPYQISIEKGVDTALVTAMIRMAVDDVYDSAVLGSTDADLCGAIEFIQERYGKKVYHLAYPNLGVDVRNTCWSYLKMNELREKIKYVP